MINPNTRVSQLDATLLDQELFNNLSKQTLSIFNKIAPIYKTKYSNEIDFILRSLLFKFTVWDKDQSYGLFLQNLKYKNLNLIKKISYYLVFILGYYLSQKLQSFIYNDEDLDPGYGGANSRLKNFFIKIFKKSYINLSKLYKILSFLNFIDFLITGKYQSLNLRLLNIKINIFSVELAKLNKGNISFEFQNRQLIWNTFLEFILFILPIFQNSKFQNQFKKLLNFNKSSNTINSKSLKFDHLTEKQCAICYENGSNRIHDFLITNPYKTNCGHIYCYICILTKLETSKNMGENWECLRCNSKVEYCKAYEDIDTKAIKFELGSDDDDEDDEKVDSESEIESDDEIINNEKSRLVNDDEMENNDEEEDEEEEENDYDDIDPNGTGLDEGYEDDDDYFEEADELGEEL
ncbi:Peroxisome assembly factor 1 [Wickerhamomyces ciferrii]|uniref:RING-type E3 ubiquitin transferase (cysteine targeting) n=1 Tax=Wickerhamomyces ciferrii (strain ATCC 14091 / BCRC 22168 / CBS 111 / JCM 3599 / NBRC 0793 / NRRL Y-1031 F-60-10) TaxID=1206466 RepID=K0KP82_WICCF|nr:Peroxisome assembly factor 1 [Wickerhamomyces ciferrii]CCH43194.1 Peroxisome assembly factor 1 [Wickerhamomyces ciferrii]